MLKKMLLLTSALTVTAASTMAMSHESGEGHEHMGPPPGLMLPLPPDTEMPAPEEGPKALVETAFYELDGDEDGQLSKDEIKTAYDAAIEMMDEPMGGCGGEGGGGCGGGEGPPMGPPPFPHLLIPADFEPTPPKDGPGAMMEAAFGALDSNGDVKLSKDEIRDAFDATMDHHGHMGGWGGEMGMDPEWEQADCNRTTGNLVIRELSIDGAVAVSLPEGREAGCFTLEVDGADMDDLDFELQIVEETDPPSDPAPTMWHSDDGKEAYEDLVLEEGIYHVEIIDTDGKGLTFTITFIDYPAE